MAKDKLQIIVGLTGGIGSGKSTIANELAQRGYAVYDCDREAKRIIAENRQVQAQIIALLGEEAFVNGQYNTAYVAQRVFAEPQLLTALNAIVHPAVKEDLRSFVHSFTPSLVFIESAILQEAGLDQLCDRVVVVDAPEDIRIARTIARDYNGQATPENIAKVRARIQAQPSYDSFSAPCLRILNDGQSTIPALVSNLLSTLGAEVK